jgi:hypothetical protein
MRSDATSERGTSATPANEPVEFSVEDAMLNTWLEDNGQYLRLDPTERDAAEAPPSDAT